MKQGLLKPWRARNRVRLMFRRTAEKQPFNSGHDAKALLYSRSSTRSLSKSRRIGAHGFYVCPLECQIDGEGACRRGAMPAAFWHGDPLAGAELDTLMFQLLIFQLVIPTPGFPTYGFPTRRSA